MSVKNKLVALFSAVKQVFEEMNKIETTMGTLYYEGDFGVGTVVYDDNGVVMEGEYVAGDKKFKVEGGVVTEIEIIEVVDERPIEVKVEEEKKIKCGEVDTDKGILMWEGEEDLKIGDKVAMGGNAVPDGGYETKDGMKVIVVVDSVVVEIKDKVEEVVGEEEMKKKVSCEDVVEEPVAEEPVKDPLEEIKNKLDEINERITAVESRITDIEGKPVGAVPHDEFKKVNSNSIESGIEAIKKMKASMRIK